ncbi:MAG: serine/threonine-protein phosphatase [Fimbriimonadaceae bacterium]|nr:serine/threonine-protein phosphatase [Fimbriimonadaceae bacterium]
MEEITAELETDRLVEAVPLRARPRITVGAKTDIGRIRENNEDKYEFFVPEEDPVIAAKGLAFIVADGMGGHEAGQIASELAVKTFLETYYAYPGSEPEAALRAAVHGANRIVLDVGRAIPSRRGMGSTLSALVLLQEVGYIAQVGDSRVYRFRRGVTELLTVDHTWVEQMVLHGSLSREEAESHPNRHMLLRAIGSDTEFEPDIYLFQLEPGDTYMICSDGITNHVSDPQINEILGAAAPSEAARQLVTSALVGGGSDNATALVVRIDAIEPVG